MRPQGALDIHTPTNRRYSHQVASFLRRHDGASESGSVAFSPNPGLSGANRHVECADCHNVHYARRSPRPAASSNIGEMLLGSWGIRPVFPPSAWSGPTSYIVERFRDTANQMEYHLCLKCHSSWAYGSAPPYTADGMPQTDQGREFNPANPAYHNVSGQPASAVPSEDVVGSGGSAPGYVSPWGPNSAMACTDCHASDPASGGTRGPHGSNHAFLLKKRFKAQAGAADNTGRGGTQADLCFDCHDYTAYGEGGSGSLTNFRKGNDNLHRKSDHARAGCFYCHSAAPHGFKRKHMIVYVSDGPPYYQADATNYAAEKGGIEPYAHPDSGSYTVDNCRAGCHNGHQRSNPVNLLP